MLIKNDFLVTWIVDGIPRGFPVVWGPGAEKIFEGYIVYLYSNIKG